MATRKNRKDSRKDRKDSRKSRKESRKTRKQAGGKRKPTAWMQKVMRVYKEMKAKNPNTRLGDAMKAAKKA
jgi:hypothetical protein